MAATAAVARRRLQWRRRRGRRRGQRRGRRGRRRRRRPSRHAAAAARARARRVVGVRLAELAAPARKVEVVEAQAVHAAASRLEFLAVRRHCTKQQKQSKQTTLESKLPIHVSTVTRRRRALSQRVRAERGRSRQSRPFLKQLTFTSPRPRPSRLISALSMFIYNKFNN